jgi:hypothetical protein
MICTNKKCQKDFNVEAQKVFYYKKNKTIKCPFCEAKYFLMNWASDLKRLENGQLVKGSPRVRMSKKQRLKLRREKALSK